MEPQKLFPHSTFNTHMPFCDGRMLVLSRSEGRIQRAFDRGGSIFATLQESAPPWRSPANLPRQKLVEYHAWKLAYTSWAERRPRRLETGLPADALECNPAFYRQGNKYCVSFVGSTPTARGLVFHLYQMWGPSLGKMEPARRVLDRPTNTGFLSPRYLCFANGRRLVLEDRLEGGRFSVEVPLRGMVRVSFLPDRDDSLLVTGTDRQGAEHTLLYRLDLEQTWEVMAPGPVYKCCLLGDRIIYARKRGPDGKDRDLWLGRYRLEPSDVAIRRVAEELSVS